MGNKTKFDLNVHAMYIDVLGKHQSFSVNWSFRKTEKPHLH